MWLCKYFTDASIVGWTNEVAFTKQVGVALIKWDTEEVPGGARIESPEEAVATLKEERKILSLSSQWCAAPISHSRMVPASVEITLNDETAPFFFSFNGAVAPFSCSIMVPAPIEISPPCLEWCGCIFFSPWILTLLWRLSSPLSSFLHFPKNNSDPSLYLPQKPSSFIHQPMYLPLSFPKKIIILLCIFSQKSIFIHPLFIFFFHAPYPPFQNWCGLFSWASSAPFHWLHLHGKNHSPARRELGTIRMLLSHLHKNILHP